MWCKRIARIAAVYAFAALLAAGLVGCDRTASEPKESSEPVVQTSAEETASAERAPTEQPASTALVSDGWLLGVELPTTVSDVVAVLGEPDVVELPDLEKDPSPWGQWFRWSLEDGAYTFSVLGESYSDSQADYDAPVKVSTLRADSATVSAQGLSGLVLGTTTRDDAEEQLGDGFESSNLADRWQFDATGTYSSTLSQEEDGLFTFFFFDERDVLAGMAQATFDVGSVD